MAKRQWRQLVPWGIMLLGFGFIAGTLAKNPGQADQLAGEAIGSAARSFL